MSEPTSGPLVDSIAQYWAAQGNAEGVAQGFAEGFNYGVLTVFHEKYRDDARGPIRSIDDARIPERLRRAVIDGRRRVFPVMFASINSVAPETRPCLEQIWYDIGYENARAKAYREAIVTGMSDAYSTLLSFAPRNLDRVPSRP